MRVIPVKVVKVSVEKLKNGSYAFLDQNLKTKFMVFICYSFLCICIPHGKIKKKIYILTIALSRAYNTIFDIKHLNNNNNVH